MFLVQRKERIKINKNTKRWIYALAVTALAVVIFFIVCSGSSDTAVSSEQSSHKDSEQSHDWELGQFGDNEPSQAEENGTKQSIEEKTDQSEKTEEIQESETEKEEAEEDKSNQSSKVDSEDSEETENAKSSEAETNQSEENDSQQSSDSEKSENQDLEQVPNEDPEQSTGNQTGQESDTEQKQPEEQKPEDQEPEQPSEPEQEEVDENAERIEQAIQNQFPVIVVSNEKAKPGDKVVVTATLVNNPGVLGTSMTLSYDESVMTLLSVKSGEAFSDVLTMSHSKKLGSGCVFLWDGEDVSDDEIQDGTILTLEFQISESAPAGKVPILLLGAEDGTVDKDLQTVELVSENGFLTIAE